VLTLETPRLRLLALSLDQLRLCLNNPAQLAADLGFSLAEPVITDVVRRAIGMKIANMEQTSPERHPWYTYWLLVAPGEVGPVGAGLLGFKGPPDRAGLFDRVGEVEIGYGIAPDYGGRGYTTEGVRALIAWAFKHEECRAVIAAGVLKTNRASICVLEKVGMTVYHESDIALFWRLERPGSGT
jgi:[ribosomal protein S5]-alanine N-acetyltransferase